MVVKKLAGLQRTTQCKRSTLSDMPCLGGKSEQIE